MCFLIGCGMRRFTIGEGLCGSINDVGIHQHLNAFMQPGWPKCTVTKAKMIWTDHCGSVLVAVTKAMAKGNQQVASCSCNSNSAVDPFLSILHGVTHHCCLFMIMHAMVMRIGLGHQMGPQMSQLHDASSWLKAEELFCF